MIQIPTKHSFIWPGLVLLLLAFLAVPASAQQDDEKRVEVRVKKMKIAESDTKEETRVLFIDEDGNQSEFHGEDFDWVSASGDDHHVFIHRGRGGSGAFLGVQMTDLTDELRDHFGVPRGEGVMVSKVVEGSPAYVAGVRVGDVIAGLDGESVSGSASLGSVIGKRAVGEQVALQVYRDGRVETMSATLGENQHKTRKRIHQKIRIDCDGEDCESGGNHALHLEKLNCGSDDCELLVNCDDDGCKCTVDGEEKACSELGLDGK